MQFSLSPFKPNYNLFMVSLSLVCVLIQTANQKCKNSRYICSCMLYTSTKRAKTWLAIFCEVSHVISMFQNKFRNRSEYLNHLAVKKIVSWNKMSAKKILSKMHKYQTNDKEKFALVQKSISRQRWINNKNEAVSNQSKPS